VDSDELSDRAEIAAVIVAYTRALDQQRWDDLDSVFTPDAHIDYSAFGGSQGSLAEAKAFLASHMGVFARTQHMLGLPDITVDGPKATAVTPCHNPMVLAGGQLMVCSLWYHHELVRTPAGWRIARLSEQRNFMTMLPGPDLAPPKEN
jgi:hypothetical protein